MAQRFYLLGPLESFVNECWSCVGVRSCLGLSRRECSDGLEVPHDERMEQVWNMALEPFIDDHP